MNTHRRLERLEAAHSAPHEVPLEVELYFKVLENSRREQTGEPPIPLTLEEKRLEHEMDNDPELAAYFARLEEHRRQREEKETIWPEGT